jgi:flagellar hook protein FlgE
MMRSLFSGVSGIKVHQTRMDVIGNNIANINTIGFKGSRTTFSDMLSQLQSAASAPTTSRGGINPRQIGLGVNVESIDLIFTDASPQSTGKNTDLALAGEGLFYLREGNQSYYTRNGSFLFDEQGNYVMAGTGLRVQGWNASSDGVINTNGATTDINVPIGKTMEATATTAINYTGNLDKESRIIKAITYTPSTGDNADETKVVTRNKGNDITSINVDGENVVAATVTFTDGTTMNVTSGYYEVGRSVPITTLATVYDSLGGKHEVTVLIDKDPDSTDEALSDNDALASGRDATVYSEADTGRKYTATKTNDTVYTYTDADGTHYIGTDKVTATAWALTADSTQAVLHDDNGYYYMDANNARVNVNESDITATAWALKSDNTKVATKATGNIYQYTDNSNVKQYVAEADITTTKVYDNRWRVYIAPGVGEVGPAADYDGDDDTSFGNTYTRSQATGNPEADGTTTVGEMNPNYTGSKVTYLYFNDKGAFLNNGRSEDVAIKFSYSDGNGAASNQSVIDFTGLTQYANSTTSFPSSNGNTAGVLLSVAIDSHGIISGTYTNGLIRQEAQISVAQFTNAAGLTKAGTTIYSESNNSGAANIRTIDDFGMSVTASALEMSNVDLATEFSDMIITQRGFQANSKMTTVSDEMLETLVNMKR